jgi:hypothetical protein
MFEATDWGGNEINCREIPRWQHKIPTPEIQYPAEIKTRTLLSIFIALVILTVDVAVIRFIRWQELIFTGMLSGLQLPTAVTLAALWRHL